MVAVKKILCALMAFALLFVVSACGDDKNADIAEKYVGAETSEDTSTESSGDETRSVMGDVEQAKYRQPGADLKDEADVISEEQTNSDKNEGMEEYSDGLNTVSDESELDFETEKKISDFAEMIHDEIWAKKTSVDSTEIKVSAEGAKIVFTVKYSKLTDDDFALLSQKELEEQIEKYMDGADMLRACQEAEPAVSSLEVELRSKSDKLIYSKEYK